MTDIQELREQYEQLRSLNLSLSMTRGQPSDAQFDLSNPMLQIVGPDDEHTPSGVAIRNYGGNIAGLPEARELFAKILGVQAEETIVGDNASLMLMNHVLIWGRLMGIRSGAEPWSNVKPKMIVTVPGYDRHFELLQTLGYELVDVPITATGPDMAAVESLTREDSAIKGIFFVPVYSNPTGDSVADETVDRLVRMPTAASDFTIFADNAYGVHHLTDEHVKPKNLLRAAEAAGNPDRVILFGSTSKVTFAGAGISCIASSRANIDYFSKLLNVQTIGPNKIEQYRHVKFLDSFPDGITGLMRAHAEIIKPKFEAVQRVLRAELNDNLATWTNPKGGYFVSLDTTLPIADRVVALAKDVGVLLTPAGAPFPGGVDPENRNIRLAPTRPPVAEVEQAMKVVALCIELASAEYSAAQT